LCTRYIPLVKARGARVIFECRETLHRLFRLIPGIDELIAPEKPGLKADYCIPVMSLPRLFKTDLASIPPVPPMYAADTISAGAARALAAGGKKFKVGIVWSGSVTFKGNRKRAVGPERFLRLPGSKASSSTACKKGRASPIWRRAADKA
jgi:hypothetical protein